ncbi:uncharacterized protein LOC143598917 [Bidens hawaiensis]|uniref:uncharacterized protein LOC143598917 n=1 Tax=Bidens hawaiensis TaxID=980011 RepID=UPI004048F65D
MTEKYGSLATAEAKALHPVYFVNNIQNKIPSLDGTSVTYSQWVKLFTLHAKGYRVLSNIDDTPPPVASDASYKTWTEVDASFNNGSMAHFQYSLEQTQIIFLSNKKARVAALEKFSNLTLVACSSLNDYCQQLQDLGEQLNDVGHKVDESRLICQLVSRIPREYDAAATIMNLSNLSWDEARTAIDLERQRQEARP